MKYYTVCFVQCVLSLIKMSRFMYGPWTSTRLMWMYYLKSRYQRLVLTRNFDDIYIVKCMSDVITNQTNPCRKHTPYQILYCVCWISSQTGIARKNTWCWIFRITQPHRYTQILLILFEYLPPWSIFIIFNNSNCVLIAYDKTILRHFNKFYYYNTWSRSRSLSVVSLNSMTCISHGVWRTLK